MVKRDDFFVPGAEEEDEDGLSDMEEADYDSAAAREASSAEGLSDWQPPGDVSSSAKALRAATFLKRAPSFSPLCCCLIEA